MTSRTITTTTPAAFGGKIAGVQFTGGSATVDDATSSGKAVIEFAKRRGWGVSGAIATADPKSVAEGKPVAEWTRGEIETYLDAAHVGYPSGATDAELRAVVLTAFETKANGGSANPEGVAGHDSGTIPPEGAPPVSAPSKPDDATEAALYTTPLGTNDPDDIAPAITVQPTGSSKVAGATATYTVTATGTPAPTYQWQRQAKGSGSYVNIEGATASSYQTPALTVADNHNDRYRVVVSNSDGNVTSSGYQQAVTAS